MLFQLLLLLSSQQKKKINLRHNNEIGSTQDEQGESAWNCDVHLNHQEIDQTFLEGEKGNSSEDFETFAFEFAKWFPRDETSRAFKEFDIEELLILKGHSSFDLLLTGHPWREQRPRRHEGPRTRQMQSRAGCEPPRRS